MQQIQITKTQPTATLESSRLPSAPATDSERDANSHELRVFLNGVDSAVQAGVTHMRVLREARRAQYNAD